MAGDVGVGGRQVGVPDVADQQRRHAQHEDPRRRRPAQAHRQLSTHRDQQQVARRIGGVDHALGEPDLAVEHGRADEEDPQQHSGGDADDQSVDERADVGDRALRAPQHRQPDRDQDVAADVEHVAQIRVGLAGDHVIEHHPGDVAGEEAELPAHDQEPRSAPFGEPAGEVERHPHHEHQADVPVDARCQRIPHQEVRNHGEQPDDGDLHRARASNKPFHEVNIGST